MSALEWALLIALSLLWGGSFFFVGVAVKELPPFTIVAARVSLAALALLELLRALHIDLPRQGRVWAAFVAMGILNNVVPFSLIVWGQTHLASAVASILNTATPVFAVVVAHFVTVDERMTGRRLVGVLVGVAGVVVLIGGAAVHSLGTHVWAQLACLAAALSYAFAGIFGRRFKATGIAPMATAAGQLIASTLIMLPISLWVDEPWRLSVPSVVTMLALLGLALASTAVAYVLYFRILASAGATNLLLVTFLIPVSAMLLGVTLLGETLLPRHLLGMGLIGLGLAAIDGRPWRRIASALAGRAA